MPDARKSPVVPLAIAAVAVIVLIVSLFASWGGEREEPAATGATSASEPSQEEPSREPAESRGESSRSSEEEEEPWEQLARRDPADPMALGDPEAPVVMISYSEFQCPFCGKFARDTEPELVEQYVENGTLRIEWRDFPYLGPESMVAARAGRAAAEQDGFWEFHDAMYADQQPPNSGHLDEDYLAGIAEEVGLDVERFGEDMDSEELQRAIEEDFAQGQAIGVTGTPAFLINGVPVIGAQPTEVFEEAIEKAAKDAGS